MPTFFQLRPRSSQAMGLAAVFSSALSLLAMFCPAAGAEVRPGLSPGGNFALEQWKLVVPVDKEGLFTGKALTVLPAQLAGPTGYTSPWFHTASDGAMTFWTPVSGATAEIAPNGDPRSELREMIDPSNDQVNWDSFGSALLEAQLKVMQVPAGDGLIIVGQAHSHRPGRKTAPLAKLYYKYDFVKQTGKLLTNLQTLPDPQTTPYSVHEVARDIKLGQAFTYQIKVSRSGTEPAVVAVSVDNGAPAQMTMNPAWDPVTFYFKAGAYLNSATSATDGGLVKFYRLAASHPANGLSIVTPSALPAATVGSPYKFALQARGGIGGSTWRLVSGFPPAGLSLGTDGVIGGSALPSAVTSKPNDVMVQVRDANGSTFAKKFSILVTP
ncbi:MAG: polysaccharide lyase family 7 protein [Pseudomonas sp.]|uniref:polysaccharide lyase family 7 protein n=1 Tax=Pseudomonas sp. TaxID=306 RepID=UPI003398A2A8